MGGNGGSGAAFMTEVILYRTTQTEYTNTYDINQDLVNYYQTALVRPLDGDAEAFINAAGITDATQISAINTLVISLKNQGLWTKMYAIYPFVGGTATTHKFNLKNPADTNAAYRLSFVGGWTHSANGALPNGTNGYANTNLNIASNLILTNHSFGIYSRTNQVGGNFVYGGFDGTGFLQNNYGAGNFVSGGIATLISYTANPSTNLLMGSRTAVNAFSSYRGTTLLATNTANIVALPPVVFFLGARNDGGSPVLYNSIQYAFAFLGQGLSAIEQPIFHSTIQTFQTALGRQV
jgi:hypothetical protein